MHDSRAVVRLAVLGAQPVRPSSVFTQAYCTNQCGKSLPCGIEPLRTNLISSRIQLPIETLADRPAPHALGDARPNSRGQIRNAAVQIRDFGKIASNNYESPLFSFSMAGAQCRHKGKTMPIAVNLAL